MAQALVGVYTDLPRYIGSPIASIESILSTYLGRRFDGIEHPRVVKRYMALALPISRSTPLGEGGCCR